jgi:hypothetical protein
MVGMGSAHRQVKVNNLARFEENSWIGSGFKEQTRNWLFDI